MMAVEDIFLRLTALKEPLSNLRLLNIYKGLPISHDASIIKIERPAMLVSVSKLQATCLELQRHTYVQITELKCVLSASVYTVNFVDEIASLHNFDYAPSTIGNRQIVRVQPADPIELELLISGQTFKCRLADISYSGVGVYTATIFYGGEVFNINRRATLVLRLPSQSASMKIAVKIANVKKGQQMSYRLGMQLFPEAEAKQEIARFVAMRQSEIQREIRTLYDALYKLKSTPSEA
jgi:hypothetical protein